jgi:quercetin dioxygenase-like cupin family protein
MWTAGRVQATKRNHFGFGWHRNFKKEPTIMEDHFVSKTVPVGGHLDRPKGAGTAVMAAHEKLANIPGKSLTIQVVDIPPGGRVPRHRHGGPTVDYMMAGVLRMQMQDGAVHDYKPGEVLFESEGAVHLFAENPSATEPATVMLICVADEDAKLIDYH